MTHRFISYLSLCALVGGLAALAGGIAGFLSSHAKDTHEYGLALFLILAGMIGWFVGVCLSRKRRRG